MENRRTISQACPACQSLQELPAIFCGACGAHLIKLSGWIIACFVSITVFAYVWFGLTAESLSWPAPLYLYYVLIFVCFSLLVTRKHKWMSVRVLLWSSLLVYAMWLLWLARLRGGTRVSVQHVLLYISSDIGETLQAVLNSPLGLPTILATVLIQLVLGFIVLKQRFGFTLAYRLTATLLAAAFLVLRYAFTYAAEGTGLPVSAKLSDIFAWLPERPVEELCELLSLNLMRALAAEIAIYSLIKSFAPAHAHYARMAPHLGGSTTSGANAAGAISLAMAQFARAGVRAGVHIQHFFIKLSQTISEYLRGLYRVVRRITVDLVVPLTSLTLVSFLLGVLAEHSAAYIMHKEIPTLMFVRGVRSPLGMMAIAILGVFLLQMLFLLAVTKFRPRSLWRCSFLLSLWVTPFLLTFFVFVSLSLLVTAGLMHRWGYETFPYRFGPLTAGAIIGLVLLVAYAVIQQWRTASKAAAMHASVDSVIESRNQPPPQESAQQLTPPPVQQNAQQPVKEPIAVAESDSGIQR